MRTQKMNCLRFSVATVLIFSQTSQAFNWNGETVKSVLHNRGQMEAPREAAGNFVPGGHNFATRRGVDYARFKARKEGLSEAFHNVYGETLDDMFREDSFVVQKILWGNFSNEVQTMLDADGAAAEKLAGAVMGLAYTLHRGVVGPNNRSFYYEDHTGYTSSNHIHSMLITSTDPQKKALYDQAHSMHKIREFVQLKLESILRKLVNVVKAKREGVYVIETELKESLSAAYLEFRNFRKGMESTNNEYSWDSRFEYALRDMGSLFHTVQDSAVACTPAAIAAGVDCIEGDGHGIVRKIDGQWKIVSLSDGAWYTRKGGKHAELDNLYRPENVVAVEDLVEGRNIDRETNNVYGSFDPAIAVGNIMIAVAKEVAVIDDQLKEIKAYIPVAEENGEGFLQRFKSLTGRLLNLKLTHDDSLTDEWKQKVPPLVTEAAFRIAETYIYPRYSRNLEELPPPPGGTATGEQHAHGEEELN